MTTKWSYNRLITIASFLSMAMLPQPGWAQSDSTQNTLSVSLFFRTHGETCGGGLPKTIEEDAPKEYRSHFLMGRTRLAVDYSRKGLEARAVLQNLAVWGQSGNKAVNLYEGWAKMTHKSGLFAQVGRIALAYDDERIIGLNDFAMASLTHDALRLGYEGAGHKVHAILCYNQNEENVYNGTYYVNGAQAYKTMQTVWYHYDVPKFPLSASLLFMNVGMQAGKNDPKEWDYKVNGARTVYQQMFGGYVNFHPKHFTVEGSYYRQIGEMVVKEVNAMDVRAWMASGKISAMPADNYGFEAGYDYLSGDDFVPSGYGGLGMVHHETIKGFSPLFGSRNKFYGIMDFFYQSAYRNGFTPGLQNAFIGGNVKPVPNLTCNVDYHYLATATKLLNLNRTLGHCVELTATYQFSKDIALTANYTHMWGTETMARLKQDESSSHARWAWFTLDISPSLFTTKW